MLPVFVVLGYLLRIAPGLTYTAYPQQIDQICVLVLIAPDTLLRDNNYQFLRCHYGTKTDIPIIF